MESVRFHIDANGVEFMDNHKWVPVTSPTVFGSLIALLKKGLLPGPQQMFATRRPNGRPQRHRKAA